MTHSWLKTNTRALAFATVLPGLATVLGLLLAGGWFGQIESTIVRGFGGIVAMGGCAVVALLVWQMRLPRLASDGRNLLVYLRTGPPLAVPLEIVECFLLGRAPAMLAGRRQQRAEAATVVVRLAESAADWAFREVKPALGSWCGGQITIRGTWCEPLNVALVQRLNVLLDEAQRNARPTQVAS